MFIREVSTDPFFSIFMARGREKEQKRYGKLEDLTNSVLGFHDRHQSMLKMGSVRLILGCYLVLIVRKVEWDELTGHSKDRGKRSAEFEDEFSPTRGE
jgi:hypothetical protein